LILVLRIHVHSGTDSLVSHTKFHLLSRVIELVRTIIHDDLMSKREIGWPSADRGGDSPGQRHLGTCLFGTVAEATSSHDAIVQGFLAQRDRLIVLECEKTASHERIPKLNGGAFPSSKVEHEPPPRVRGVRKEERTPNGGVFSDLR
jgi:hypothetical protein